MKKLFALLIVLASFDNAFAQWIPQISGTSHWLTSVYFTDSNTGYAVGDYGTILKTTNGGNLWISQNSGNLNELSSVFFANMYIGYAVGYSNSTDSGIVLKTIDGGMFWTAKSLGVSSLTSVYFPNPDMGFVTDNYGNILKTTDGGASWVNQSTGAYNYLLSIYFPDVNTGYAVGGSDSLGIILKTNNGGVSWTNQNSGTAIWIESVFFINADTGYAVGQWGLILKTTNGGNQWTPQTSGTSNTLTSVFFVNADTGYVVGQVNFGGNGIILKTINGGVQWIKQNTGTSEWLQSIFLNNADTGYAVGNSGTILKTEDGGGYPLSVIEKPADSNSLKVYPNPSSDNITIETSIPSTKSQLSIMNISGQQCITRQITEPKTQLDISNLPSGVYFVRLTGERVVEVGKFIKH